MSSILALLSFGAVPLTAALYAKDTDKSLYLTLAVTAISTVVWGIFGFSMIDGVPTNTGVIGTDTFATINKTDGAGIGFYGSVFYQLQYALLAMSVLTASVGHAFKPAAWMLIALMSLLLTYLPQGLWFWNAAGWARTYGIVDWSGGMVVHGYAGFAALIFGALSNAKASKTAWASTQTQAVVFAWIISLIALQYSTGNNSNGFTVGVSDLAALNTLMAVATSVVTFGFYELALPLSGKKMFSGMPSIEGATKAAVVGVVAVSAGAGLVFPMYTVLSVFCTVTLVYFINYLTRNVSVLGWDAFVIHSLTGFIGSAMVGLFAQKEAMMVDGSFFGNDILLGRQCAGISTIILMTGASSVIIYYFAFLVGKISRSTILVEEAEAAAPAVPAKEAAAPVETA